MNGLHHHGMGDKELQVMGKPRKSCRMIDIVLRTRLIKNFRVAKVYDKRVIAFIKKHESTCIQFTPSLLEDLNSRHLGFEVPE